MEYQALYRKGKALLQQAQIPEADLDARLLLEFVCDTDRNDLLVHGDREVEAGREERYFAFIEKRAQRIPLQHLTGEQEFMGLNFKVNEHVLIPRQDTEILVEEVLRYLHDGFRILDMCTGSGCILLSLLNYSNDCVGIGMDLSEEALKVASFNAEALGLKEKASFIQSNLFEKAEGKFEMIVSNPPYIQSEVIKGLMPEVRDHEPMMALDGGEDGLYFYRKITAESINYLCGGGMLFFEIGYDQGMAVKDLMEQSGFKEVTVVKDFAGLDRVVYGTF